LLLYISLIRIGIYEITALELSRIRIKIRIKVHR